MQVSLSLFLFLFIGDLSSLFSNRSLFQEILAPLKERLLVTDLQSYFVEAGVAKDLCDRQTKLMLEAEQPI